MSESRPILLVEDDEDAIDIALRALDKAGLQSAVEVAWDGLEALEKLGLEPSRPARGGVSADTSTTARESRQPGLPGVVLLDLKMPRINGWEVLRRMREHPATRQIPVVVVSSSDREIDIEESYRLGANSFVVKGFESSEPGEYIAAAAVYWVRWNRTRQARVRS